MQHRHKTQDKHQDAFVKFPKALMAATHWISLTTGEEIQFTPSNKILWLHIKDRFDFFASLGNGWFDNQEAIAAATGSNISTVKRFLADLTKHGYLKASKKKVWGCAFSNSYTVVQDLVGIVRTESKAAMAGGATPTAPDATPEAAPIVVAIAPTSTVATITSPEAPPVIGLAYRPPSNDSDPPNWG
ncbi:DUF6945 domain-containing protein [Pseudomonas fluorescens]|uniref:DUF6945 domain-containing protein n=1 Tax=Pseudomonas fluorescens TaxID=294 RepID=UPI0006944B4E|nr:hypothetical protein [Pseudomonas fluorescens]